MAYASLPPRQLILMPLLLLFLPLAMAACGVSSEQPGTPAAPTSALPRMASVSVPTGAVPPMATRSGTAGLQATATVIAPAAVTSSPTAVATPGYRVIASYPHDPAAFTQGLVVIDGTLYEGTGLEGASTLRRVELDTGKVLQSVSLPVTMFGEGVAVLGERIYQLTWQSGVCFVYDRVSFEVVEQLTYSGEGWGLTTDGARLIMSDGSSTLTFRDPATFAELGRVEVLDAGVPVEELNELEYIDGEVWANVWKTDRIARIDPATGEVIAWVDLTGLRPASVKDDSSAVLNGIAWDAEAGRLFVTGKLWPTLFEIAITTADH